MATPIKITPVLKKEDSKRFNKLLVAQQNQKVSQEEKKRIESLVARVLAKSKFSNDFCGLIKNVNQAVPF